METLAVIWALRQFRQYLFHQKVVVFTDHSSVKQVLTKPNPSGRIARWSLSLEDYPDIEFKHRAGAQNRNADSLSRCFSITQNKNKFLKGQQDDLFCKMFMRFLNQDELPVDEKLSKKTISWAHQFTIINDLLYFVGNSLDNTARLVIPESYQKEILEACHDTAYSGHFGFAKTYTKVKLNYFWPTLYMDVKKHCENCLDCITRKSPTSKTKGFLTPIPVAGPMDRVAVDILGPLPITENGNKYIIVFCEYLTKFCITKALPNITADTVARTFVDEIVLKFGAPTTLLSDQGSNFMSQLVKKICELCGTKKQNTSPYHPMTDGLVERTNKTLAQTLSMYINGKHNDWDLYLKYA